MDVLKVVEGIVEEIVDVLVLVVEAETISAIVERVMRVDVLKAVVGMVVEIVVVLML